MKQDNFIAPTLTRDNIDRYYHRRAIFEALNQVLPLLHGHLLDTACGGMPYREYILNHSKVDKYVGLDIENAAEYNEKVKPDLLWDGLHMPIADHSFECAIATEVLEHVPNPHLFLSETYRVLKPGGFLFFTTPFLWPLHEIPHDQHRITPFAMKRYLLEAGFQQEKIEPMGGWHASMAQMLGLWLKRGPMNSKSKKMLITLLLPLYKYLLQKDKKFVETSHMITGISGYAYK